MIYRKQIIKVLLMIILMGTAVYTLGFLMKIHISLYQNSTDYYTAALVEHMDKMEQLKAIVCIVLDMIVLCAVSVYMIQACRRIRMYELKNRMVQNQLNIIKDSVDQLQEAYLTGSKSYKAKSRFMNRMSHDLRTPMNAIMGYSVLMERAANDPEKVKHYSGRIFVAGQSLLELINDALDMGCIESGNLKLIEHEFRLDAAFEEVKTAIKPQMEVKHQIFNFYMTNSTDKNLIVGDKRRFCQVLRNILSNASKYTGEGGTIDLSVNVIEEGSDGLQMIYQVKDTGCGMNDEFLSRIFEPFQREDNEMNTSVPGTGLGMSIVKSFTELMNGNVSVESKEGAGTLVTVRLPLKATVKDCTGYSSPLPGSNAMKGMRFLAAEDNESNAEILKEVLAAMGAECTLTENGQATVEAFEKSAAGTYDAILMDIQMPVMNGYQAAKMIRNSKHPEAESIVIIAMTADAFEEDVQKAFVSGMNAHVAKPLNMESFIGTIKTLGLN